MNFLPRILRPQKEPGMSVEDGLSDATFFQGPGGRRATLIPADDKLTTFRLMVGIQSTSSLGGVAGPFEFAGRSAPNIGIYNRVVQRERKSKQGYKFASLLINGCLGLQIVVAASLTAMGAANSDSKAVTAFGAINTIIAGMLTYLKGSGLPNRLRYYENEWKKIREYIEQREREFTRPDCDLDVLQTVETIENMYEEVKADIQTNTPDNFVSVGDVRNRKSPTHPAPRLSSVRGFGDKHKDLDSRYGGTARHFIADIGDKVKHMGALEKDVEKELESGRAKAVNVGKDFEKELEERRSRLSNVGLEIDKELKVHGQRVEDIGKEAERQGGKLEEAAREVKEFAQRRMGHLIGQMTDLRSPAITINLAPNEQPPVDESKKKHDSSPHSL